jgi:hypothetical protein
VSSSETAKLRKGDHTAICKFSEKFSEEDEEHFKLICNTMKSAVRKRMSGSLFI